jgi:N-formylglutamate deformylase
MEPPFSPFNLAMPDVQRAPIVLTSPHSGRRYLPAFLAASRLDAVAIRRSEDSFVDELFGCAPAMGVPLLAAAFPRAYCDVNREAWELDPAMFHDSLPDFVNAASPRVVAGLGTIARIVGTGEPIYRQKMLFAEAEARIAACWTPYHAALRELVEATVKKFGMCLVIDCHSMPSTPGHRNSTRLPEVVLGDVHGTSCAPQMIGFIETKLSRLGLRVRRNDPYAGGYITRHYGQPRDNVHALQIEVLRALYMDEARFEKSAKFDGLSEVVAKLLASVVDVAMVLLPGAGQGLAEAAE